MIAILVDYLEIGLSAVIDSATTHGHHRSSFSKMSSWTDFFVPPKDLSSLIWRHSYATLSLVFGSVIAAVLSVVFLCSYFNKTRNGRRNSKGEILEPEDASEDVANKDTKNAPKRERVRFYYNKWMNRVNSLRYLDTPAARKRLQNALVVRRLASNLINRVKPKGGRSGRRSSDIPRLLKKEPPASYLEELSGVKHHAVPAEVLSTMRAIRVFGHLEEPVFLELCRQMISMKLDHGEYLFQPGDADDSVYIVQGGRLMVFIRDPETQREICLKEVRTGENISSMLSILDVLSGHQRPFRTVTCRAIERSTVIRMPVPAFAEILDRRPEALVRVVQLIMTRMQRVTFSALRDYLGLSHELMRSDKANSPLQQSPLTNNTYTANKDSDEIDTKLELPAANMAPQGPDRFRRSHTVKNRKPAATADDAPDLNLTAPVASSEHRVPPRTLKRSVSVFEQTFLPEDDDFERARRELVAILGLPNHTTLEDRLVYKRVPMGMYLVHEFDHESNLYYVVSGCLSVSQKSLDRNAHLFIANKGELVGTLAVLTGEPSLFNVRAKVASKVLVVSRSDYFDLLREYPKIALNTAHCFAQRLSSFARQIDFALDWEQVESGRAIYRQGDVSDSIYVVLNGRLRSVIRKKDGSREPSGEFARGDLVGLTEVSVHKPRMSTIIAVRDTEIAKVPAMMLEYIKHKYPKVVTRLIQIMGDRIFGQMQEVDKMAGPNLTTVAVVGAGEDVPLDAFCLELELALNLLGSVFRLTSSKVEQILGASVMEPVNEYRLATWLGQQEDSHRMVLFQCDDGMTTWTKHCLRQADCVLIVANGDQEPSVGYLEKELDLMDLRAEKRLVLLHRPETVIPKNTVEWLNIRSYVKSHHHIKCPQRVFLKKDSAWFEEYYQTKRGAIADKFSGFSRLARVLLGKSVGLVLGGGGARGCAHVGVIKSMLESGIPIDYVGGTSIGSFIGALWCEEMDMTGFIQRARQWSAGMNSWLSQLMDLTYPYVAMFKGRWFNKTIEETFGDRQIEDLWIPYFNITTDITTSSMRVHRTGCLWRYVRASMSLSGYMPPLCDPVDGHLLLDGGYVNNLPADVMQQQGANFIIAVDVGSQDDHSLTNYGDELSGWWPLWNKLNPFYSDTVRVPTMAEVQTRLAYVSCVRTLEIVKNSDYCIYVRPPIESYKTLDFQKFDEIYGSGYEHARGFFGEAGMVVRIEELFEREEQKDYNRPGAILYPNAPLPMKFGDEYRFGGFHYTFTDLAQIVSQIKRSPTVSESSSSRDELSDVEMDMDIEDEGTHDGGFSRLLETPPLKIAEEIEKKQEISDKDLAFF